MSEPNIYAAATAYATVATAVTALVGVYFAWLQARQYVLVESSQIIRGQLYGPPKLELSLTLRNRRRASIQPWFVEIRGLPGAEIESVGGVKKGPDQPANAAPFPATSVPPNEAEEFDFIILFDWEAALSATRVSNRELRWEIIVTFNDRVRERKRWSRRLTQRFEQDQLARYADVSDT